MNKCLKSKVGERLENATKCQVLSESMKHAFRCLLKRRISTNYLCKSYKITKIKKNVQHLRRDLNLKVKARF